MIVSSSQALPDKIPTVVLFAQPGAGKTTLSFTMPKPLHYDTDKGIDRAEQSHRPDFIPKSKYEDFKSFVFNDGPGTLQELVEQGVYESFIIDTVGTFLEDVVAPWLIRSNPKNGRAGGLSLQGWGSLGNEFSLIKTRLVDELGLKLCLIAHRKADEDGGDKQWKMAVKGGSNDVIERSADMIGYMYLEGSTRWIEFDPTNIHVGKNPAGLAKMKVPKVGTPAYDGFLEKVVIGEFMKSRRAKSNAQVEAAKLVKEGKAVIDKLGSLEQFEAYFSNELKEEANTMVKTQLSAYFREKMADQGIGYHKDKGWHIIEPEKENDEKGQN